VAQIGNFMQKPLIIGIAGGSGSGKTTFINHLKKTFSNEELCVISQDDYYYPREDQVTDENGVINFDLPDSIDKKAFRKDLELLIAGETVEKFEYAFNNKDAAPKKIVFIPAPIIIVEGLFIFHYKKIKEMLDLKIFFHAHENLKIIRRIKRDKTERNYPLEDVLYRYEHHVMPSFEKYVKPYVDECDIIINNNQSFSKGLNILIGFLKSVHHENTL
jgi:uridine kinase